MICIIWKSFFIKIIFCEVKKYFLCLSEYNWIYIILLII